MRVLLWCRALAAVAVATVAVAARTSPPPWSLNPATLLVRVIRLERRGGLDVASETHRQFPRAAAFPAVDGSAVDVFDDAVVSPFAQLNIATRSRRSHWELSSRGAVGAYLSHLRLLQQFLGAADGGGDDVMLVLEDDADVPADLGETLAALAPEMPPPSQWDVWLVGPGSVVESAPSKLKASWPHVPRSASLVDVTAFWGVHAYLVSRRGAARIVEHGLPIVLQIDGQMTTLAALGKLAVLWRADEPRGLHIRERAKTVSTVQNPGGCDICEMPTGYWRKGDVAFWVLVGVAATLGARRLLAAHRVQARLAPLLLRAKLALPAGLVGRLAMSGGGGGGGRGGSGHGDDGGAA